MRLIPGTEIHAACLLFDMDGTLVDTLKMTARAFDELSGDFGLPPLSEARIRAAIGLADPEF